MITIASWMPPIFGLAFLAAGAMLDHAVHRCSPRLRAAQPEPEPRELKPLPPEEEWDDESMAVLTGSCGGCGARQGERHAPWCAAGLPVPARLTPQREPLGTLAQEEEAARRLARDLEFEAWEAEMRETIDGAYAECGVEMAVQAVYDRWGRFAGVPA